MVTKKSESVKITIMVTKKPESKLIYAHGIYFVLIKKKKKISVGVS